MEIENRLAMMQTTYAASVAETANTYEKLGALEKIVAQRKERQAQNAPYINRQLGIERIDEVFLKLSEIYGCANWAVETAADKLVATATSCKLCALSKKMGGANPCSGWCLDPMIAMMCHAGKINAEQITVESTLMNSDCCKILVRV